MRGITRITLGLAPLIWGAAAQAATATITLPPISVGAGARTSFTQTDVDVPDSDEINDFNLDSARIYIGGSITETIKFTFNTEFQGDSENDVQMLDAIGRFEFSPQFNIWAGRFLPPSDRANLYGPYYANNAAPFVDGVQDGYPFVAVGRNNGVAYWGDFDRLKVSLGLFDAGSTLGDKDTVIAGRLQFNFWDLEPGYYLNGTYYGEKDILAIGVATHAETSGTNAYTVDLLMEKKVAGGGAFTIESEYAKYDEFGGYTTAPVAPSPAFTESDGFFVLGAYLFPQAVGMGKFQLLAKYGEADYEGGPTDFTQETLEFNVNYIIKAFNARISLFYVDSTYDDVAPDLTQAGLRLQLQI